MQALQLIFSRLRYFAPVWVFASLNIMVGTWVLYIPTVKDKLGIDDGQLGIALFCFALGTLMLIPFVPFFVKKYGVGRCTGIGILCFSLTYLLPIQASSFIALCFSLFLTGAFAGFVDVAMNALVSEIEREDGVSFMSAAHGFFSLGGVIGAGVGSILLTIITVPLLHLLYAGVFVILTNLLLMKSYYFQKNSTTEKEKSTYSFQQLKPLFGLAFIALIIMGSEGAIEHWSKLFLLNIAHAPTDQIAGYGFITFSAMMTLGRFMGDAISAKFGSIKIIVFGCLLGAFGYGLLMTEGIYLVIAGFGLIGLGFSGIIPELFRLAGNTKGISASAGISFVSGIGFLGFLGGPVMIGLISRSSSLKMSFMTLLFLAILALFVTITLRGRRETI